MSLINKELKFEKFLLDGLTAGRAKLEHINRVKKRIELIEKELSGVEQENNEAIGVEEVKPEVGNVREEEKQKVIENSEGSGEASNEPIVRELPSSVNIDLSKIDKEKFQLVKNRWESYEEAIAYLQEVHSHFLS